MRLQGRIEKLGDPVDHVVGSNYIRARHGRLFFILLITNYKGANNPLFYSCFREVSTKFFMA